MSPELWYFCLPAKITVWDILVQLTLLLDLSISFCCPIILSSSVLVLVAVAVPGSPPAGEDDGVGGFISSAASMTCCVFFAVINDAGDYPILSAYRACRDARRRVETGVSPTPEGGCGGHPPHIRAYTRNRFFAYQPQVARRREPPPMPFAYHCYSRQRRELNMSSREA